VLVATPPAVIGGGVDGGVTGVLPRAGRGARQRHHEVFEQTRPEPDYAAVVDGFAALAPTSAPGTSAFVPGIGYRFQRAARLDVSSVEHAGRFQRRCDIAIDRERQCHIAAEWRGGLLPG
jgi:hypothetical protein